MTKWKFDNHSKIFSPPEIVVDPHYYCLSEAVMTWDNNVYIVHCYHGGLREIVQNFHYTQTFFGMQL